MWATRKCRGSLLEARWSDWIHLKDDFCSVLNAALNFGGRLYISVSTVTFFVILSTGRKDIGCISPLLPHFHWNVQRYFIIHLSGKLLQICFSSEAIQWSSFQFWALKAAYLKSFAQISPFFQLSINIYSIILVALLCISVGPSHVWRSYQ